MFTKFRLGTAILFATVALVAVAAAGCGDDDEADGDGGAATEAPAATSPTSGVEIDISGVEELEDGTLTIGSDIAYPPIEFLDESNNVVGLDVDLAKRLGEALGVEVDFQNGGFDTLLPALDTERYDAIMSSMTATQERKQNYDFVEYFNAGAGIVVLAGNPKGVQSADDLCGLTVATQEGTTHVDFLEGVEGTLGLDQKCRDAGKEGVQVLKFGTDPEAVAALTAGQADAELADFPVAAYSAQQSGGTLEIIPEQIDPAPYGIALRKSSTALRDALQAALELIREDGTYEAILQEWNLEAGALD